MAQPPAPETFPSQGITDDDFKFLQEVKNCLAYDPDSIDELLVLLTDIGKHAITDVQHVLDEAEHLLQGHPHLAAQFYGLVDPVRPGLVFLKRAEKALGPANYDRFVAKLYSVDQEKSLDAHGVYQEFKELIGDFKELRGEERDDLLRGLAGFLPTNAERIEHRRRPERKQPSYAGADAPESSRPSRAKKPRVGDVGPTPEPACFADTGAAGSSRPTRARRPRMYQYEHEYDGLWPERKHASFAVSIADDSNSSRPIRSKKSRADDSFSGHADAPVGGAAGGSVRVAAAAPAPAPDANAREVKRFREAWEFETGYSLLDATLKRAKEVKGERERLNGVRASVDELFPRPEIRGYLAKMYQDKWNHMRRLLEHGGDHTAFALEAIVIRLTRKDAEAVEEARRRQDPARAAQRLQELAQARVRFERERVRDTKEQRRQP